LSDRNSFREDLGAYQCANSNTCSDRGNRASFDVSESSTGCTESTDDVGGNFETLGFVSYSVCKRFNELTILTRLSDLM
jgi:hypothetical protein